MNRKFIISILGMLISVFSQADQPRGSNLHIWSENDDVYVLHSHVTRAWTVENSDLRIIRKDDGKVIFNAKTTPFTKIVPVEGGAYFAGLSDLQAGSMPHGYNFALFDSMGNFISRVYVSRESGYCEKVRQSVSQSIGWFSRNPKIKLDRENGEITNIVVSPYYADSKPCYLPVGDHLIKLRSESQGSS